MAPLPHFIGQKDDILAQTVSIVGHTAATLATDFENIIDFYIKAHQLEYIEISPDLCNLFWEVDVNLYRVDRKAWELEYRKYSVFLLEDGETLTCNLALNVKTTATARPNWRSPHYESPYMLKQAS
jgi:hypothetical protein